MPSLADERPAVRRDKNPASAAAGTPCFDLHHVGADNLILSQDWQYFLQPCIIDLLNQL